MTVFAFGGFGYGNVTPYGAKAYLKILKRRNAVEQFLHVLEVGTPEAKCYALMGLLVLDPVLFENVCGAYETDESFVHTGCGCICWHCPLGGMVMQIRNHPYAGYGKVPNYMPVYPNGRKASPEALAYRQTKIPEEIHRRIRGAYKTSKLKRIWFVWTLMEDGRQYTQEETDAAIRQALARIDMLADTSHIRVALCELKFMARSPDGRVYQKISSA